MVVIKENEDQYFLQKNKTFAISYSFQDCTFIGKAICFRIENRNHQTSFIRTLIGSYQNEISVTTWCFQFVGLLFRLAVSNYIVFYFYWLAYKFSYWFRTSQLDVLFRFSASTFGSFFNVRKSELYGDIDNIYQYICEYENIYDRSLWWESFRSD